MEFTDAVGKMNVEQLLLLPQRKYRDILRKARAGRPIVVDLLGDEVADDEDEEDDLYADFIEQNAIGSEVLQAQVSHSAYLERLLIINIKSIKKICEYLAIREIAALYVSSTRIRSIYEENVSETKLLMSDFCKFVNSKFRLRTAERRRVESCGLLSNKLLTCSHVSSKLKELDCCNFTKFFNSGVLSEFNISLRSLFMVLDHDINLISIQNMLSSMVTLQDSLLHLSLEGSAIGFDGISYLCYVLNKDGLASLRSLNINRNNAGEAGIRKLRTVLFTSHCPNLEDLRISSNQAGAAAIEFFELVALPRRRLAIPYFECGGNHIDCVEPALTALLMRGSIDISHLLSLDMSCNPLGEAGFMRFMQYGCGQQLPPLLPAASLISNVKGKATLQLNLRSLNLCSCEIGNNSLYYLASMLSRGQLPSLQALLLSGNNIGAIGVDSLLSGMRALQPNCNIRELSLSLNNIGNEGMMSLTAAIISGTFDQVKILDIADCGCVMESITKLGRAISVHSNNLTSLRSLRIFGNQFPLNRVSSLSLPKEFLQKVQVS